jgi:hypothetical protein
MEPAFPFQCQGQTTGPEFYYGINLREYIMVHAQFEELKDFTPCRQEDLEKFIGIPEGTWHNSFLPNVYTKARRMYAEAMIEEMVKARQES